MKLERAVCFYFYFNNILWFLMFFFSLSLFCLRDFIIRLRLCTNNKFFISCMHTHTHADFSLFNKPQPLSF